jgi:S1-C subfamily serine protease
VAAAVGSAVVEITTSAQIGMRGGTATGTGSGFVVDDSGLILTNNHVVENATQVQVAFSTGETLGATVVGTDSTNDLALIKVDSLPDGVSAVTLGDSDAVAVGETAIAIGSPFGLEQTVTQGIVSAVDRDWTGTGASLSNLIQTDTPINPGNSGGPLLNAAGEVIGINTLIESPVEGNVGVGFAVPINVAKQQLSLLETGAAIEQGYLGVSVQEAADGLQGVTVGAVESGSGAAAAGVAAGDVIRAIDGASITDYASLAAAIDGKQPGTQVSVTVERGGETLTLDVTLQARSTQ